MDPEYLSYLWKLLVVGYLFTIAIETPILMIGLSPRHPMRHRVFAGFWLTACTYPILLLVLPQFINPDEHRTLFLSVGETFVPLAECALFWAAFGKREERWKRSMWRDLAVVVLANLASFGFGEVAHENRWFDSVVPPPPLPANPEGASEGAAVRDRPGDAGPQGPLAVFEALLAVGLRPSAQPPRELTPAVGLQIRKVAVLGLNRTGHEVK